jgi:hypothetical protein
MASIQSFPMDYQSMQKPDLKSKKNTKQQRKFSHNYWNHRTMKIKLVICTHDEGKS